MSLAVAAAAVVGGILGALGVHLICELLDRRRRDNYADPEDR